MHVLFKVVPINIQATQMYTCSVRERGWVCLTLTVPDVQAAYFTNK
jgi:hypothetical protein